MNDYMSTLLSYRHNRNNTYEFTETVVACTRYAQVKAS